MQEKTHKQADNLLATTMNKNQKNKYNTESKISLRKCDKTPHSVLFFDDSKLVAQRRTAKKRGQFKGSIKWCFQHTRLTTNRFRSPKNNFTEIVVLNVKA